MPTLTNINKSFTFARNYLIPIYMFFYRENCHIAREKNPSAYMKEKDYIYKNLKRIYVMLRNEVTNFFFW